jgi:hypothetical protein
MKKLLLTFAAVFTLLGMAAPAAEAQIYFEPGYYGPRFDGGPYYRRWYGPGYVRVNPFFRPYANSCFRWQFIPTSIGPQWRMMNVCPQPAFVGPIYPYRRAFYY